MSIWFRERTLAEVRADAEVGFVRYLGIELTELGPDFLRGELTVTEQLLQPYGILHGGVSVALAETLGSMAASLCIDRERHGCVGLDINANHVRPMKAGSVIIGTARPLHIGRTTHVWEIRITDSQEKLVCVSRITMSIIDR
jgi:1,4-dihydroxy-2-naphthoyl-CoA hydrolase